MTMSCKLLTMELELYLPHSFSLKDKRRLRLKILDKIKSRFNMSIKETDLQDHLKFLVITGVMVCLNETEALNMKEKLTEAILTLSESEQAECQFDFELM